MKVFPSLFLLSLLAFAACSSHREIAHTETKTSLHETDAEHKAFLYAEEARLLGKNKEAQNRYEQFIKQYKRNATAYYNLARLQLDANERIAAEKNASIAVKLDPENQFYREFYAQALVSNRKYKAAIAEYNGLIDRSPLHTEYLYGRAIIRVISGNYAEALGDYRLMEKMIGFHEDILLQKESIYLKIGQPDSAIAELQKLKANVAGTPKYDLMIADIYQQRKMKEKVSEIYQQIEKEYPEDPLAQVGMARYFIETDNKVQYNLYMKKIMRNKNLDVKTKISLLLPTLRKLETDSLEREELIEHAHLILQENPDSKEAMSLYADLSFFMKRTEEALPLYKQLIVIDAQEVSHWNQLLSIYADKQQQDSVIYFSRRCLLSITDNATPYFYLGVSFQQRKEYDSSIAWLSKGIPFTKENKALRTQFYSILGDAFHNQKEYTKSDSCFTEALQIQPDDAGTLNNYAYYLSLRKEKLDTAEQMSKRSLLLQPNTKSYLDTYGWILFQKGEYKKALSYIQQAIQAGGQDDGTLFEHLGDVYYKLNDIEKAKQNWEKAKQKGEDNPLLIQKINKGVYTE